jgi:hypothetical protein
MKILIEVINGLEAMHNLKIIHRDIKTANILMKDGIFKLGLFINLFTDFTLLFLSFICHLPITVPADFNVSRPVSESGGVASTMAGTMCVVVVSPLQPLLLLLFYSNLLTAVAAAVFVIIVLCVCCGCTSCVRHVLLFFFFFYSSFLFLLLTDSIALQRCWAKKCFFFLFFAFLSQDSLFSSSIPYL